MPPTDVWDKAPSSQRKHDRYQARWKVALVYEHKTFPTLSHDLSLTGISVHYHLQEKASTSLTLLLTPPPINGIRKEILKLQATVTSSIPFRGGYRLGMVFKQDSELDKLQKNFESYIISEDSLASPDGDEFPTLNL